MRLFFLGAICLLLCGRLYGEEALSPVQRELRARKFYFGEIDGRASEETVQALKKFQEAKGIDHSGNLDDATLRALGLSTRDGNESRDTRALEEACDLVLRYLQARQSDDWSRTEPFYAGAVDYYFDRAVKRPTLRARTAEEDRRWPQRKYTLLNRVAALLPERSDTAQVTARVFAQVVGESGAAQSRTEDLIFRLRKTENHWQIIALKLLE